MDSIAASIEQIQYPTVTACREEFKLPDNWAFLETILNNVAFECTSPDSEWNLPPAIH